MSKKDQKLEITYFDIEVLKPYKENPRYWSESAMTDLMNSIQIFGLIDPIIITQDKKIVGGHMRIEACKRLGIKTVPTVAVNVKDKRFKELLLRLNYNVGNWDYEKLKIFETELLVEVGFEAVELNQIWDEVLETEEDGFKTEEEIKKIDKPKSKLGDIYKLGPHYIACGDSQDPELVKGLMNGKKVSMIYCDPIYNINLDYSKGIGTKGKYGGKAKDKKTYEEYSQFLKNTIQNALMVAKKDCHVFYYCDQIYIGLVQQLYKELGINSRRVCLWIKNSANPTPQVAFSKCYEACPYGTIGRPYLSPLSTKLNEVMNREVTTGNRVIDDIYDLIDIWLVKRLATSTYTHPTEKPLLLHEKSIKRCTAPGDIVLDLFSGSGSTLLACEQLNRICYTVDIDPLFVDLTIKRYEQYSGKKAKKIN